MTVKITIDIEGKVYEIAPGPGAERELLAVFQRAINTWESPPKWVLDLHDRLLAQYRPPFTPRS